MTTTRILRPAAAYVKIDDSSDTPWRRPGSKSTSPRLPFFTNIDASSRDRPQQTPVPQKLKWWQGQLKGWNVILLHSWLNICVAFIPVAWLFSINSDDGDDSLLFVFCILSLIPLVNFHDLTTRELAIRIGGSKTGLLNATMANTVEIVVAFSALRKCELRVVQSSLIGTMLSKLLLVLGLCFFAGGMRFTEQDFDPTANQIHSSLLSISVGTILLPAAYHFTLSNNAASVTPLSDAAQKQSIFMMSHSVSVILLVIYFLYLFFQLWSHTHLYKDSHKKSAKNRLSTFKNLSLLKRSGKNKAQTVSLQEKNPSTVAMSESPLASREDIKKSANGSISPPRRILSSPKSGNDAPFFESPSEPAYSTSYSGPNASRRVLIQEPTVRFVGAPVTALETQSDTVVDQYSHLEIIPLERNLSGSTLDSTSSDSVCKLIDRGDSKDEQHFEAIELSPELQTSSQSSDVPHLKEEPRLSVFLTIVLLAFVTSFVAIIADWLVESMNGLSPLIRKEWVALILLPAVSSIAECVTAINVSVQDQLSLSISVAVGSTIQTSLFVIPLLVVVAWILGKPLSLLFDPFESLVLYIAVQTMTHVVADGKSNWLEGAILIGLYAIIAVSFWFYPGSSLPSTLAVCTAT